MAIQRSTAPASAAQSGPWSPPPGTTTARSRTQATPADPRRATAAAESAAVTGVHASRWVPTDTATTSTPTVAPTRRTTSRTARTSPSSRAAGSASDRRHSWARATPAATMTGTSSWVNETSASYGSSCQGECARTARSCVVTAAKTVNATPGRAAPSSARPARSRTGAPTGRATGAPAGGPAGIVMRRA